MPDKELLKEAYAPYSVGMQGGKVGKKVGKKVGLFPVGDEEDEWINFEASEGLAEEETNWGENVLPLSEGICHLDETVEPPGE
jgi:hypothetical protein